VKIHRKSNEESPEISSNVTGKRILQRPTVDPPEIGSGSLFSGGVDRFGFTGSQLFMNLCLPISQFLSLSNTLSLSSLTHNFSLSLWFTRTEQREKKQKEERGEKSFGWRRKREKEEKNKERRKKKGGAHVWLCEELKGWKPCFIEGGSVGNNGWFTGDDGQGMTQMSSELPRRNDASNLLKDIGTD